MVDFIKIDCSFPFDQVLKILDYETIQLQSNLNIHLSKKNKNKNNNCPKID